MALNWDSIQEGDALPELSEKPGVTQLVKYAAGGGDFNPLHHDYNFEHAKALGSILVHGKFKYAVLGELVSNWLNHQGRVKRISCQYRGMDYPDNVFICKGTVERKWEEAGEKLMELTLWAEDKEGKQSTTGKATVVFKA